ncbi:MAG: hypothetical protein ACRC6C_02835 [Wolbachia pipientis]
MLLACYSHKHISYRIRTIIRKAILRKIGFVTCLLIFVLKIVVKHTNLHYM